jgi:hypothetical protein
MLTITAVFAFSAIISVCMRAHCRALTALAIRLPMETSARSSLPGLGWTVFWENPPPKVEKLFTSRENDYHKFSHHKGNSFPS